ncbi:hypothetical protein LN736_07795 [Clostridium sp. WLY-B-L2]|uniref:Uncharacterized protein n=1 Tax=Clostridium aromativorans TaxID=2836848 RepID=A0ABS8N4P5_9CLOT|nr:hypothetical protein [Clostridium aromativorans]MCC9294757.1 hypothetical protein [Clostridium aromativorans]
MNQAESLKSRHNKPLAERSESSAFGHQTLLISYHGITFIEYININCIDGNRMRKNPSKMSPTSIL